MYRTSRRRRSRKFAYRFVQTPRPFHEAYLGEDIGVFIVRLGSQAAPCDQGTLRNARKNIDRIDRESRMWHKIPAKRQVLVRSILAIAVDNGSSAGGNAMWYRPRKSPANTRFVGDAGDAGGTFAICFARCARHAG